MEAFSPRFSPFIEQADDDFWNADLVDPTMQDVLRMNPSSGEVDWHYMEKELPTVVLIGGHDRLMTDAALGTGPIKTEHSYSLASDGDSLPDSPISHNKLDEFLSEMEEECFPAISMDTACERISCNDSDRITVKDEPISECESAHSSCPSSPQSTFMNTGELHFQVDMKSASNVMITSPHSVLPQRLQMAKMNIKIEPGTAASSFHLPPTPPSFSSSEDSEDNATISRPPSPNMRKSSSRVMLNHHSTRQPIHTPLISSQPKGSTGTLLLTEEEKRTLIAEGYPVPTRLPLTKAEEKSLKKIRRKIKNKISAQESRRKKKEYMDQLERKVEILVSENNDYRGKIENLEDSNTNLLNQLQKLQQLVARTNPQLMKQLK